MRTFILLTTLALCWAGFASAQSLEIQAPFDFTSQFQAIEVAPNGVGFAAGTCGSLLKTTDDGESWAPIQAPMADLEYEILGCQPGTNCQTVLMAAPGFIFRSTNGGDSWTSIELDFFSPERFAFMDGGTVLLLNSFSDIWRSTDNGQNWSQVILPAGSSARWFQLDQAIYTSFRVEDTSPAEYALVRSTDQGDSWDTLYTHPSFFSYAVFQDSQNGMLYATDRSTFFTTDGGTSWTLGAENLTFNQPTFYPIGNDVYHAHVFPNRLSITTDAGQTWIDEGQYSSFGRANNVQYRGTDVFIAGDESAVLKSTDLAMSFEVKNEAVRADFTEVVFFDENVGYVLGNQSTIGRTTDGGENWIFAQPDNFTSTFLTGRHMEVLDNGDIIATWGSANASLSTDGGNSWQNLLTDDEVDQVESGLEFFDVLDNGRIIFVMNEQVMYSDNGGQTWNFESFDELPFPIRVVEFLDNDIGFVAGNDNKLYKTSNGGLSWQELTGPYASDNSDTRAFFAFDEMNLLASRGTGASFSSDGGQTWNDISDFPTGYGFSLDANGRLWSTGFASGNNGSLHWSDDMGQTWNDAAYVCHAGRGGSLTPNEEFFYMVGDGGLIARVDTDLAVGTRSPRLRASRLNASPNPTSGFLTLDLSGQDLSELADIQVFDLNGRLLMQRNIQNQPQIDLDLSAFAQGIYLVRVQGNGWLQTGRVIRN
ncbi:MAG: YCF48-related protein [Bacteroidota bacterium]